MVYAPRSKSTYSGRFIVRIRKGPKNDGRARAITNGRSERCVRRDRKAHRAATYGDKSIDSAENHSYSRNIGKV